MNSSPNVPPSLPIVVDDVTFSYAEDGGYAILRNMSATFCQDQITLISGPSGCGKSTLLYVVAGLFPRNAGTLRSGSVRFGDRVVHNQPPAVLAEVVGMVFQNPELQFCMDTVENELRFCMENANIPRDHMDSLIHEVLTRCDINHLRSRLLRTLSGGEKQMVALASVLIWEPHWILLDEPFANVDDESATRLVQLVAELNQDGVGILVVDHRFDHWVDVADVCLQWEQGQTLVPVPRHAWHREIGHREPTWRGLAASILSERKTTASGGNALVVDQLVVNRGGNRILGPLSQRFDSGKIYAIVGKSGSGKSTLFDVLLGAARYSGSITLGDGALHHRGAPQPGAIGFVMQQPQDQFVADTVSEEIVVGLQWRSPSETNLELVEQMISPIGLWAHRDKSPYMLSQGQQRRLGVAALLPYKCQVLVCDEPTYAQDDASAVAIMTELLEIVVQQGTTLIFSTHDRSLAAGIADCVLELRGGCLHEID